MRFAELTEAALLGTDRQTIAAVPGTTGLPIFLASGKIAD